MLPKKNRLDKKTLERVFKTGRSVSGNILSFKFIPLPRGDSYKLVFIAPKSIAKLATHRNYLRRKGYEALKQSLLKIKLPIMGAFIYKKYEKDSELLKEDIERIISRIN